MTTITNHLLRQQIKSIASGKSTNVRTSNMSSANATNLDLEEEKNDVTITTKKFQRVGDFGNTIVFPDNTKATILQPMPCMRWSCKKTPDETGLVILDNELEATIITIGNKSWVLGFNGKYCGVSTELELLVDLGETELCMNNEFYSVKAQHHAKDGVEQK